MTEVGNETEVEISKTQESMEFFDGCRLRPVLDSLYLPLVLVHALMVDDVT